MTLQYLNGELSIRLGVLHAAVGSDWRRDVAKLRQQAEDAAVAELGWITELALTLTDDACWRALCAGDATTFHGIAAIAFDLAQFGSCAGLLAQE